MIGFKLEMKNSAIKKLRNPNKMNEVIEKTLDMVEQEFMRNVQLNASQANFKNTSGQYIKDIKRSRKKGYVYIYSVHPAAFAIEYGFKNPRPMNWLVTGHAISFKTADGKTIIRRITAEMIGRPSATSQSGLSWTYPAMEGKFIFGKSIKQTMPFLKSRLTKIFKIIVEED